jgi:hypothetical protein
MEQKLPKDMSESGEVGLILIDPPVGPFSPKEDILDWIEELKDMPQVSYVPESIAEAQEWLKRLADE